MRSPCTSTSPGATIFPVSISRSRAACKTITGVCASELPETRPETAGRAPAKVKNECPCHGRNHIETRRQQSRESGMMRGGGKRDEETRREFLAQTSIGLAAGVVGVSPAAALAEAREQDPSQQLPAGAPPAFGTGPAVGPGVARNVRGSRRLVQIQMTGEECARAASSWRGNITSLYERRTSPRKIALEPTLSPFSRYNSVMPGQKVLGRKNVFVRSKSDPGLLPRTRMKSRSPPSPNFPAVVLEANSFRTPDADLFEAHGAVQSPKLRCVITLTRRSMHCHRLQHQADAEVAAGHYRGPLHGVPWAARIFWTLRVFPRRTAPNPAGTASQG